MQELNGVTQEAVSTPENYNVYRLSKTGLYPKPVIIGDQAAAVAKLQELLAESENGDRAVMLSEAELQAVFAMAEDDRVDHLAAIYERQEAEYAPAPVMPTPKAKEVELSPERYAEIKALLAGVPLPEVKAAIKMLAAEYRLNNRAPAIDKELVEQFGSEVDDKNLDTFSARAFPKQSEEQEERADMSRYKAKISRKDTGFQIVITESRQPYSSYWIDGNNCNGATRKARELLAEILHKKLAATTQPVNAE